MHRKIWKYDDCYSKGIRPLSSVYLLSAAAVQNPTFLDTPYVGGGQNSLLLHSLHYNSRVIWTFVHQPGWLPYPDYRILSGGNFSIPKFDVSPFFSESNFYLYCQCSEYSRFSPDIGSPLQFPAWHFGEHLSRALPTEMILYLLRSIDLQRLQLHDYSPKSMLDFLETVIKWLEVSVSMYDWRTPAKKIRFVSRGLDPSDQATCPNASCINSNSFNLLQPKHSVPLWRRQARLKQKRLGWNNQAGNKGGDHTVVAKL